MEVSAEQRSNFYLGTQNDSDNNEDHNNSKDRDLLDLENNSDPEEDITEEDTQLKNKGAASHSNTYSSLYTKHNK